MALSQCSSADLLDGIKSLCNLLTLEATNLREKTKNISDSQLDSMLSKVAGNQ
jgi:hypothetical protein